MIPTPSLLPPTWTQPLLLSPGLYIVSTPIGNTLDITLRALKVLEAVDLIACEDTRHTAKLLAFYGIKKPLISYHDHNEAARVDTFMPYFEQGKRIALVSDAGTPLIADPGYRLVTACVAAQVPVIPIPGVSAIITALSIAGLPSHAFSFYGFLPSKQGQRQKTLSLLKNRSETLIFYEAPHRMTELLEDINTTLGDRLVVIARELTKTYEEVLRGPVTSLLQSRLHKEIPWRGEMVVLVAPEEETTSGDWEADLREALSHHSLKQAVELIATVNNLPRRDVYQKALELKAEES